CCTCGFARFCAIAGEMLPKFSVVWLSVPICERNACCVAEVPATIRAKLSLPVKLAAPCKLPAMMNGGRKRWLVIGFRNTKSYAMPYGPRTRVFVLPPGIHANPMRGPQL